MNPRHKPMFLMIALLAGVGVVVTVLVLSVNAGDKAESTKPVVGATTQKSVKESDLNVVTLTPDAEKRLGIRTAPVEQKPMRRTRLFGGEVTVPPGRAVVVSAPVAGTVSLPAGPSTQPTAAATQPAGGTPPPTPATDPASAPSTAPAPQPTLASSATAPHAPVPGETVMKGQPVFALQPLLTAEARTAMAASLVDAEGQVRSAEVLVKAASIALERARQLLADQAGSQRALDEAHAQYEIAQKTLEAAQARRDVLKQTLEGKEVDSVPPISIASPTTGVMRNVHVAAGQAVSSGTPLFEVLDASRVWVRVAIYAGDAGEIATDQSATVTRLGGAGRRGPGGEGGSTWTAKPIAAPPSSNAPAFTVDLFYALDNEKGDFRPAERLAVTVPLRGEEESLVVPWSAVTFDIHGGAWVYEAVVPRAYVRRRVEVRYVDGAQAVLAIGPAKGTAIVTEGVAELFGREMGFAK